MLVSLKQENERLSKEVSVLKQKLNQTLEESVQYRRLRGELLFAKRQPDQKVFAEIISGYVLRSETCVLQSGS